MTEATKYITQHVCCQCFFPNDSKNKLCGQCGYLLLGEATEGEKEAVMKKLEKMKEKRDSDE